jgi:tetratricopeptide (TPR) repeat protein/NAD-dependent dihydropyrimidine dehydrogenase PreA subunit
VLLAVHLLIAAHATHYLVAGRTLSPVEPSEAMYTLELGEVNAGFIFLLVALLATLVFGRFFCGWGCHIVAVQDLCGWLMKKLGVRPRPFRSRLLIWVPLAAGFYMFLWPTIRRVVFDAAAAPFPGFSNHLMTDSFWMTFPGPLYAVLTIATCGFAAVYFLGAKGFCTYGCPYGGLFGVVDKIAPGRIVVDDSCEQCGHCTVTCTSNVVVHEEVRRFGQVVDPGCMKCMDCVSVCPKGALSFSFAKPSLFKKAKDERKARRYPLSLAEELAVGALCFGGTLAFRGLYDGPPLLMSIGLGGITAWIGLKLWKLLRGGGGRMQNLQLRRGGRLTRAGKLFGVAAAVWLLFTAHSGFVQWQRAQGRKWLNKTEAARAEVLDGSFAAKQYSTAHHRAAARTMRHFSLADRWGLAGVVEVKLGLAWGQLLEGDAVGGEQSIREAIAIEPGSAQLHANLIELLLGRGRLPEAAEALETKAAAGLATAEDRFALAGMLAGGGELERAIEHYAEAVDVAPDVFPLRFNYGGALRRLGRDAEAIVQLREAERLAPTDFDTQVELGLASMAIGDREQAIVHLRAAVEMHPDRPESVMHLPELIRQLESGE